jgi:peroxiredoxin Q/BCP
MPSIDTGAKAPSFTLRDQDGRSHSLESYLGRPVVLFFYPKDDTPGCTKEACSFRDTLGEFAQLDATVLGISILDVNSKAAFARKYGLTFPLLADENHAVADAYGVWGEKTFQGRTSMGVSRATFLIDRQGHIARRWDNVKVDGHSDDVLSAVRDLP